MRKPYRLSSCVRIGIILGHTWNLALSKLITKPAIPIASQDVVSTAAVARDDENTHIRSDR